MIVKRKYLPIAKIQLLPIIGNVKKGPGTVAANLLLGELLRYLSIMYNMQIKLTIKVSKIFGDKVSPMKYAIVIIPDICNSTKVLQLYNCFKNTRNY